MIQVIGTLQYSRHINMVSGQNLESPSVKPCATQANTKP
jgi:hypothetical protein